MKDYRKSTTLNGGAGASQNSQELKCADIPEYLGMFAIQLVRLRIMVYCLVIGVRL